jgi:hypothetical protein
LRESRLTDAFFVVQLIGVLIISDVRVLGAWVRDLDDASMEVRRNTGACRHGACSSNGAG